MKYNTAGLVLFTLLVIFLAVTVSVMVSLTFPTHTFIATLFCVACGVGLVCVWNEQLA